MRTFISNLKRDICIQKLFRQHSVTSHLSLVPFFLKQAISFGDVVVDATAGNGHDSITLANLIGIEAGKGTLISMDIQKEALERTKIRLLNSFAEEDIVNNVQLINSNHNDFTRIDPFLPTGNAKAFVYNLGYLPGGDKTLCTQVEDTIISLKQAAVRTAPGGILCITCYRGHEGGLEESMAVKKELTSWEQTHWRICEFNSLNWPSTPILYTAHRFEIPRTKRCPKSLQSK